MRSSRLVASDFLFAAGFAAAGVAAASVAALSGAAAGFFIVAGPAEAGESRRKPSSHSGTDDVLLDYKIACCK